MPHKHGATADAIFRDLKFDCKRTTDRFDRDKPDFLEVLQLRLTSATAPFTLWVKVQFPRFPLNLRPTVRILSTVQSTVPCAATRCGTYTPPPKRQVYRVKYVTGSNCSQIKSLKKFTVYTERTCQSNIGEVITFPQTSKCWVVSDEISH